MTATAVQEQARALGDPTRHAIFRRIAEADVPLGVADLNAHFDLNHNAIRQHLAKLVEAGLVIETKAAPHGRGRPRLVYALDPAAQGHWGTVGPFERLSRLLVEVIRTGLPPEEIGRRAAPDLRVPVPTGDGVVDIASAMARQGFDPEVRAVRHGAEVVLHHCPFASAAIADRATVCALHLGLAEGLSHDARVSVEELIAYDPRTADCRIRVRTASTPSGAEPDEPAEAVLTLRGARRTRSRP